MAARQVPGRGPHARGRGVQRRGRDGLDPDDARLDRHPRQPRAAAGDARADRAAAVPDRVRDRPLRAGRGLHAGGRQPRAAAGRGGASSRASSTRRSCASASSRPSASSRRPARTPSAGAWPSATSAAGRRSSGSPRAADNRRVVLTRPSSGSPTLPQSMVDERVLAERLIGYDTSRPEELVAAAGFVKGWLESRDIEVSRARSQRLARAGRRGRRRRRPGALRRPARPPRRRPRAARAVRAAGRGRPADRPRRLRHEGRAGGDDVRAQGRRAARTASASGSSACPTRSPRRLDERSTDAVVASGLGGDFAITGEPTDMHIGVAGQGRAGDADRRPRARRPQLDAVARRQRRAEGDRRVPRDRVAAVQPRVLGDVRPAVDQPRADRGRRRAQQGARPLRDGRRRPLPARPGPGEILAQVRAIPGIEVTRTFIQPPVDGRRGTDPTCRRCARRSRGSTRGEVMSVGRDGASDAASFIEAGIPAVEFGPAGGGHHGPEEWVSLSSLRALPPGAGGLRARAARSARRQRRDGGAAEPDARSRGGGVSLSPPSRGGALWRFALAARARDRGSPRRRPRSPGCSRSSSSSTTSASDAGDQVQRRSRSQRRASPQTILLIGSDHRAGEPFKRRQHRHDAARPAQRQLVDDQRAVDPARPRGQDPRLRHRASSTPPTQDGGPNLLIKTIKQNVFPDFMVNHIIDVNFGGFVGPRQRDRLRLHRRRPPLLQQHRAAPTTRASTSSPATRSCAATTRPLRVRALPPHRHRPRPQRPPAGLHPLGQGPVQRRPAVSATATSC